MGGDHVQRMTEERTVKKVLNEGRGGRRARGRGQEEDRRTMLMETGGGVRRWRRVAQSREEWRRHVVLEACRAVE